MAKYRFLWVLFLLTANLNAQSDYLWAESQQPRKLLRSLYDSLQQQHAPISAVHNYSFKAVEKAELLDRTRLIDTLIFLDKTFEEAHRSHLPIPNFEAGALAHLIQQDTIPCNDDVTIFDHLRNLYHWNNQGNAIFKMDTEDDKLFTTFLTVADKADGNYDGKFQLPNLPQFYKMLVRDNIPLPAICYNCREDNQWRDRRTLLASDNLTRELPKNIRKLALSKAADERKLAAVNLLISKRIVASEDGWKTDYWQTPEETLLVEEGDCEDFAILYCAIANYLGVTTHVVVGDIIMMIDGEKQTLGHAWVEYEGRIIDPIMNAHYGGINYKGHFRFNQDTASLVLPGDLFSTNNRLAKK